MTTNTLQLLSSLGATLSATGHSQFNNETLAEELPDNFISPIPYYGILLTQGPDSSQFLQGQTTCDFKAVTDDHSRLGAFCNPKGRMISSFLAARQDDQNYLLRMRRDIIESTKAAFGKYIVFSKAEQTDISDQVIVLGLYGEKVKAALIDTFGNAPTEKNQVCQQDNQLILQLDEEGLTFECWLQIDNAEKYWTQLSQSLKPTGSNQWQRLTIQQGIGELGSDTIDEFIPQLLNFTLVGAVSFDKGCYTGQEVVARMHYKGKPKRGLYRIQLQGNDAKEGQELFSDGEQAIGTLVNIATISTNDQDTLYEALAVLAHSEKEKTLSRKNQDDRIGLLDLPYAITSESK